MSRNFCLTLVILSLYVGFSPNQLSARENNMCSATGNTLKAAKSNYRRSCPDLRLVDCDPKNSGWICASYKAGKSTATSASINPITSATTTTHTDTVAPVQNVSPAAVIPTTVTTTAGQQCVDDDGDGWGWDGAKSCRMGAVSVVDNNPVAVAITAATPALENLACVDPDGDGWGWDGTKSCKVSVATVRTYTNLPVTPALVSENRQCRDCENIGNQQSQLPDNCNKLDSGRYHITELVTDVILTAGQSNAAGNKTHYQPWRFDQDKKNDRLIVWTTNNQWQVADPKTQLWHGKFPNNPNGQFNHPGFQIGRAIADSNECRVVALIATAAPGMPIDYWRHNENNYYNEISTKVNSALNTLPGKYKVDMIWWMQGEADNDEIVSRYVYKLKDLINRFRAESWFTHDGYFLANETRWHPYANEAIRQLRNDEDKFSDFSRGQNSLSDPFPPIYVEGDSGVHFNEVALRKIGDLVAHKYLREYLQNR